MFAGSPATPVNSAAAPTPPSSASATAHATAEFIRVPGYLKSFVPPANAEDTFSQQLSHSLSNLYGPFYSGKTTLVSSLLHVLNRAHQLPFQYVFWVDVHDLEDLQSSIATRLEHYQRHYKVSFGIQDGVYRPQKPIQDNTESQAADEKRNILLVIDGIRPDDFTACRDGINQIANHPQFSVMCISRDSLNLNTSWSSALSQPEMQKVVETALSQHKAEPDFAATIALIMAVVRDDLHCMNTHLAALLRAAPKTLAHKWTLVQEQMKDVRFEDPDLLSKLSNFLSDCVRGNDRIMSVLDCASVLASDPFPHHLVDEKPEDFDQLVSIHLRGVLTSYDDQHRYTFHARYQRYWFAKEVESQASRYLNAVTKMLQRVKATGYFNDSGRGRPKEAQQIVRDYMPHIIVLINRNVFAKLAPHDQLIYCQIVNEVALTMHYERFVLDSANLFRQLMDATESSTDPRIRDLYHRVILHNYVTSLFIKEHLLSELEVDEACKLLQQSVSYQTSKLPSVDAAAALNDLSHTKRLQGRLLRYTSTPEAQRFVETELAELQTRGADNNLQALFQFDWVQIITQKSNDPTPQEINTADQYLKNYLAVYNRDFQAEVGFTVACAWKRKKREFAQARASIRCAFNLNPDLKHQYPQYGLTKIIHELLLSYQQDSSAPVENAVYANVFVQLFDRLVDAYPSLSQDARVVFLSRSIPRAAIAQGTLTQALISAVEQQPAENARREATQKVLDSNDPLQTVGFALREVFLFEAANLMVDSRLYKVHASILLLSRELQRTASDLSKPLAFSSSAVQNVQQEQRIQFKNFLFQAVEYFTANCTDANIASFAAGFSKELTRKILKLLNSDGTSKAGHTAIFNFLKSLFGACDVSVNMSAGAISGSVKLGTALQGAADAIQRYVEELDTENRKNLLSKFDHDSQPKISAIVRLLLDNLLVLVIYTFGHVIRHQQHPSKFGVTVAKSHFEGCRDNRVSDPLMDYLFAIKFGNKVHVSKEDATTICYPPNTHSDKLFDPARGSCTIL